MERQQVAEDALSRKWKTQIDLQTITIDLQMKTIEKAAQSVANGASDGAWQGVKEALGAFNQAMGPNLSELKSVVEDIQEARKGFEKASRY
jgi:flagellar biosynthesis/type III secretory pathway protein FliH